ncbi:hypothetical protein [Octadecabacter algicola]|uniref:hypothetical protein n=1 Tax=Octadecabacter algicola TaxID=2909342 RepID=UPI001F378493|nr:hypothetical protein [Octadecabacter algicola]
MQAILHTGQRPKAASTAGIRAIALSQTFGFSAQSLLSQRASGQGSAPVRRRKPSVLAGLGRCLCLGDAAV